MINKIWNNVQILENKLNIIEKQIVEADNNTESEKEEVLMCIDCGIVVESKTESKVYILALHPSEFACKFCGQLFGTSVSYELHLNTHDEVDKIKCDLCNQYFYMKWRLSKHEKQHQLTNVKYCNYFNNGKKCEYL